MALRPLTKIAKLANFKVTIDPSGKNANVHMPTLSIDDIDRTGNVSAWRIQKMMTTARIAAYHLPNEQTGKTFLEYDKFTADFYTFLGSLETEVSRDFYSMLDQSEWAGIDISFYLGHVGQSSLNTVATLKDPLTGKVLVSNTNTVVCVDKGSRKPAMIPEWWKNMYQNCIVDNKKLIIPVLQVPSVTNVYQVKVPWSDVDAYKHTNYLAYLRYCLDAIMDAMNEGNFTHIKGDLLEYHVKKLQIRYIGETVAQDILNVYSWQNKEDPYTLHFSMKRGENIIFQNTMQFYDN